MLKILFFASLRDNLKCSELHLSVADNDSVEQLLMNLQSRDNDWFKALTDPNLMIAVNQKMSNKKALLKSEDEIALFPPVTGG